MGTPTPPQFSSASSGSATTKFASELIFGANTVFNRNKGAGTGFVARIITSPDSDLAEDEIVTVTDDYGATAPLAASGPSVTKMASFKASTVKGIRRTLRAPDFV
jgi:hypothetical protein